MPIPKDRLLPAKVVETAPIGKYHILYRVLRKVGVVVMVLELIGLCLIGL